MNPIGIAFGLITALSAAGACLAQAPPRDARAGEFKTFQMPDFKPVERTNGRYPLSDQSNAAGWTIYRPMTDDFRGRTLDPTKWLPTNPGWKGRQPAFFNPANVTVRDGCLRLTMRKQDAPTDLKPLGFHDYSSAAVQSVGRVLYGYFEVRAKPMRSAGSSSFWFYGADPNEWTEIDVFEIGGRAKGYERRLNITLHVMKTPTVERHWQIADIWTAPADLDANFHVYGLEWDAKELKFYFDGVLVRRGPNTYWHQPLTLNFDSETMPDWFGMPRDEDLPSTYQISYIRAWKRPGDSGQ
jgi:beta-glucanase (GH16 family)